LFEFCDKRTEFESLEVTKHKAFCYYWMEGELNNVKYWEKLQTWQPWLEQVIK